MKIEVTAEDIANGIPEDCMNCPVALALQRAYPNLKKVHVTVESWRFAIGDSNHEIPADVEDKINAFDIGEGMTPFSFELT